MSTFLLKFHFTRGASPKFLKGPPVPKEVRRFGYYFTEKEDEAWPFPSRKQAENKERIIYIHMGKGAGDAKCCTAAARRFLIGEVIERRKPSQA